MTLPVKKAYGGVARPASVRNLLAVASGKGGVGKTTLSWQIALGLSARGLRVGLLDADIYGPNIFSLLEIEVKERPKKMLPYEHEGIALMSMAMWLDAAQALMWRGPMIARAVVQLMRDTLWTDLDVLIVDLPPGTGDIHLSLLAEYGWIGYVMVTTAHRMAREESVRIGLLFEHYAVPLLMRIVNLSHVECSACGHRMDWLGPPLEGDVALPYCPEWAEGRPSVGAQAWLDLLYERMCGLDTAEPTQRKRINIAVKPKGVDDGR